jgi:hypothetical protein
LIVVNRNEVTGIAQELDNDAITQPTQGDFIIKIMIDSICKSPLTMMQIPSSNQSHRSRRSTERSTAAFAHWFDGFLCCSSRYTGSDAIDDNSIVYNKNHNTTLYGSLSNTTCISDASVVYDDEQESMQWPTDPANRTPRKQQKSSQVTSGRSYRMENLPMPPSSDATATTVLTGSTSSSRTTSPLGNYSKDNRTMHHRHHKQINSKPTKPVVAASSKHARSHSTGNIITPEEEWQQQQVQLEEARMRIKPHCLPARSLPAKEVVIPDNWTHDYGLRRIWSETLPKLPFATVKLTHRH